MNPITKARHATEQVPWAQPATQALRSVVRPRGEARRRKIRAALVAVAAGSALALVVSVVPTPPTSAEVLRADILAEAQSLTVSQNVATALTPRESYTATPGIATLAAGGTNHDWAKLVLLLGGWQMSEANVTVITRWMRQENGVDDWWNRNNPLNNGWGSGGGGGLGSYPNLIVAAENAAAALHKNPGYSGIVASFASNAATEQIESAIWASPWATSHYHNGGHWSYKEVPAIKSPAGTWG